MALSEHANGTERCPLSGAKRIAASGQAAAPPRSAGGSAHGRKLFNAALIACIKTPAKLKLAFSRLTKRMNRPAPTTVRRRFFVALGYAIHVTWPVLSAILGIQIALGLLIGFVEGWSVGDAVYFTFVTGLTIGYGDIVPRQALARVLAIGIGVSGLFLTGLIAGIAVYATRTALTDHDTG
jgi:hypothetical protein